jgi:hypothetical protein
MTLEDRSLLLRAWLLLNATSIALTFVRYRAIETTVNRVGDAAVARRADVARARHVSRLVEMAARHTPISNTCLHRASVLTTLLRREGIDAQVRLGVRKNDGILDGHAWVECGGTIVPDGPTVAQEYAPLSWRELPHA